MNNLPELNAEFINNDDNDINFLDNLASSVVKCLIHSGLKVSTAESLTGGMIAEYITSVPGASEVIELGVVSYTDRIKSQELFVSEKTLEKYTAVSQQTAIEMAKGIMKKSGSDISVSVTGIAGPDGGTDKQPVGTVYACVIYKDKINVVNLKLYERYKTLDRKKVRMLTCAYALKMIEDIL